MKKLLFVIGILVFILVFGIIGCDSGSNNEPNKKPDEPEVEEPEIEAPWVDEPYNSMVLPDVLKMRDGTAVTTAEQWPARRTEIRSTMQYNSYGKWRSGETVSPIVKENILTVRVLYKDEEGLTKGSRFDVTVELPKGTPPEGGWPVILAFGGLDGADGMMGSKGNPRQYALDKGYANISVPTNAVASDDNNHKGAFYTLYPYGTTPESQTGVLMAWAWGASKVVDALEMKAAAEFNINAKNTIITGTSRNGKAAAVAGAFEKRFKITVPVSSGAGGAAIYRYFSNGQTYDLGGYFSYNGGGPWTIDENNPQSFSSIKADSGGGWFNNKFKTFSKVENLPFDQHFLLALCAAADRYLFMINGFEWDKWTNPPGFFYNFESTKPVFDLLGVPQNIAVSMHRYRHGIEQEDMVKLIKYANFVFYGKKDLTFDFAETEKPKPATWEEFMQSLHVTPFSASVSPSSNNETYESGKPK